MHTYAANAALIIIKNDTSQQLFSSACNFWNWKANTKLIACYLCNLIPHYFHSDSARQQQQAKQIPTRNTNQARPGPQTNQDLKTQEQDEAIHCSCSTYCFAPPLWIWGNIDGFSFEAQRVWVWSWCWCKGCVCVQVQRRGKVRLPTPSPAPLETPQKLVWLQVKQGAFVSTFV